MGNFRTMKSLERESTDGTTAKFTKVLGLKTKCMGRVNCLGQMARCMKEILETTRDTGTEPLSGRMEKYTEVLGIKANSMAKVLSSALME